MDPLDALARRTKLRREVIDAIYDTCAANLPSQGAAIELTRLVAHAVAKAGRRPLPPPHKRGSPASGARS